MNEANEIIRELLEQIDSLQSYELSRDLEPYKAQAIFDGTIADAREYLEGLKSMSIDWITFDYDKNARFVPSENGDFVRYQDAWEVVTALQSEIAELRKIVAAKAEQP